ncbi:MAG TPA: hypothetical protein VKX17_16765 [Planctomycetota bacterium]|nr:hypothetical protein [Planctomycetota bacterium]
MSYEAKLLIFHCPFIIFHLPFSIESPRQWKMRNGKWTMDNGQWTMENKKAFLNARSGRPCVIAHSQSFFLRRRILQIFNGVVPLLIFNGGAQRRIQSGHGNAYFAAAEALRLSRNPE